MSLTEAEELELLELEAMAQGVTAPLAPQSNTPTVSMPQAAWEGVKRGTTFGFGDEIQAGVAAGTVGLANMAGVNTYGLTASQAYEQALQDLRRDYDLAREQQTIPTIGGEIIGGLGTALARPINIAAKGAAAYAAKGVPQTLATATGLGAASGGVYGYGTGEGGVGERLQNAGTNALYGGGGGLVGAGVGQAVGSGAKSLVERVKAFNAAKQKVRVPPSVTSVLSPSQQLSQITEASIPQNSKFSDISGRGMSKVISALKKDYPDNYEQILDVWSKTDEPLAVVAGNTLNRRAMGAAQYEGGFGQTKDYFKQAIPEAKERLMKSAQENIGDASAFYTDIDDFVARGRAKAAPLYDKAYEKTITGIEFKPEVQKAIKSARNVYESRLAGLPDNSVEVLDYAKREIDDLITSARRTGDDNRAGYLKEIKNEFVDVMKKQVPEYRKALETSGDYLSMRSNMENGIKFDKLDPELLKNTYKGLAKTDAEAFKLGVSKRVASLIDDVNEGANPYNRVFGSEAKRKRLQSILSPNEYKKLEIDMKSTNKLFEQRNQILGNSTTTSKALAALELSDEELLNAITSPAATTIGWLKNRVGMGDKTADQVAKILYERDQTQKLVLLKNVIGDKSLTNAEKSAVQQYYHEIDNMARGAAQRGSIVGGAQAAPRPEATIYGDVDYQE